MTDRDEANFGRKIAEFKPKFNSFIFSLLGGTVLLALGFYIGIRAFVLHPQGELIFILLAILFFYLGAVLVWSAYRRFTTLNTSYNLYEHGVQRLDRAREESMTWSQVKIVKRRSRAVAGGAETLHRDGKNRWRNLELSGADGRSLTISEQPRLATMITGMLLVYDWPLIQRQIENGEKVPLSRLFVSREGLEYKGRLVPWSKIKQVETTDHIKLDTVSGKIRWPEINIHDHDDVLGYLMLQRVIEYYVHREQAGGRLKSNLPGFGKAV